MKCFIWSLASQGNSSCCSVCPSPLWAPPPCLLALPLVLSLQYPQPLHVYWRVHMAVACEVGRDLKTRKHKHSSHFCLILPLLVMFWPCCTLIIGWDWMLIVFRSTVHTSHAKNSLSLLLGWLIKKLRTPTFTTPPSLKTFTFICRFTPLLTASLTQL